MLDYLNVREAGGYSTIQVDLYASDDAATPECRALLFTGTTENEFFCGPDAELDRTADIISRARGPSGPNDEYLFRLAEALRQLGVVDRHVNDLERLVLARTQQRQPDASVNVSNAVP